MHELLYAVPPAAVSVWAGARLWAHRREVRQRPGEAAPPFDLMGTDGKRHSLAQVEGPAVALLFMSNRCPGVKAYDDRLRRLIAEHRGQVAFVGLNPVDERHYPREDLRGMRQALLDRGLDLLYLKDTRGAVAQAYGAVCTPEIVLLDAQRRIAYRGRIDDSMVERGAKRHYLRHAIDAVLDGRMPRVRETIPLGCSIVPSDENPIVAGARKATRSLSTTS